jgi:hypothetical protein
MIERGILAGVSKDRRNEIFVFAPFSVDLTVTWFLKHTSNFFFFEEATATAPTEPFIQKAKPEWQMTLFLKIQMTFSNVTGAGVSYTQDPFFRHNIF